VLARLVRHDEQRRRHGALRHVVDHDHQRKRKRTNYSMFFLSVLESLFVTNKFIGMSLRDGLGILREVVVMK
jgi:hypothetical protein